MGRFFYTILLINPPTPSGSGSGVMETVTFRATHATGDGSFSLVVWKFPLTGLAGVLGWEVIPTGMTVGSAGWVAANRPLTVGKVDVISVPLTFSTGGASGL